MSLRKCQDTHRNGFKPETAVVTTLPRRFFFLNLVDKATIEITKIYTYFTYLMFIGLCIIVIAEE